MPSRRVEFPGSQGSLLAGRLDSPDTAPRGRALFAHCFTCSKESKAAAYVSRALVEAGFEVLRFDFTGIGGSGGDFANTDFSSNIEDLIAAAGWLRANHGRPDLLIGHSLGGAAALAAAGRIADAAAVVTIAAPFDPGHLVRHLGDNLAEIEASGQARVDLGGGPFTISRGLIEDITSQNQEERIRELNRPLLVLHAPLDDVVGIDEAGRIFQAARHPKSFVSLDGANHLLTNRDDARFAASVIAAWAARYVEAAAIEAELAQTDDAVHVSERGTGAFTVAISAGQHSWLADEPISVGGDNLGPSPYQMLSASLGACTVMTMRMYARQKGWPLENASVSLTHEKVHAKDCADCETKSGKIDRIERQISIEGDLDSAQRQRLLEIADRCPVHRTLHAEVQIVTREA